LQYFLNTSAVPIVLQYFLNTYTVHSSSQSCEYIWSITVAQCLSLETDRLLDTTDTQNQSYINSGDHQIKEHR
jgi:hypothetical protein